MGSHWRHGGSLSKDVSVLGWLFSSRFVGQDIHATQSSHLEILSRRKSTNNNIVTTAKRPNPAIWPKMLGHMGLRGRFFTRSSLTFCWTWTEEKKNGRTTSPLRGSWEFVAPLRLKPTKGQRRVLKTNRGVGIGPGGGFCGFEMGCLSEEKMEYSSYLDGRRYETPYHFDS